MRIAIVLALLLGCAHRPPAPRASAAPSLVEAMAWERGTGRGRDYRRAAAIYEQLCNEGKGDATACRRWIGVLWVGRGVARDAERAASLGRKLCKRGQVYGCFVLQFTMVPRDRDRGQTRENARVAALFERAEADCLAGDTGACETEVILESFLGSEGSDHRTINGAACKQGVLFGCAELVRWGSDCDDEDADCLAADVARWRAEYPDTPKLLGHDRLDEACRAGDADACRSLPGRAIPLATLCAAHDYRACAEAACVGRASTRVLHRRLAEDHDVDLHCQSDVRFGEIAESTPACGALAGRLSGADTSLRDELEHICLEQRWSKEWATCLEAGGDNHCEAKRGEVIAAIGKAWPYLATTERIASCDNMEPLARQAAVSLLEVLYVDFAELLDPELDTESRLERAGAMAESAGKNAQALPTWGCPGAK
jgi:hypothetical protein